LLKELFSAVFFLRILPRANRPDGANTLLPVFAKKIPLIFLAAAGLSFQRGLFVVQLLAIPSTLCPGCTILAPIRGVPSKFSHPDLIATKRVSTLGRSCRFP
jgi:hypothetical protein